MIGLTTWARPNEARSAIMLEVIGPHYTGPMVDLGAGAQFAPEVLAISANSETPAPIDRAETGGRRAASSAGLRQHAVTEGRTS